MVISVSPAHEGRTISSFPDTTTKNGTVLSPCSTSTWPGCIARICPCTAMRLICSRVNIGNICSTRELVRGSPLGVLLIAVLSSAGAPQKLLDLFKMHLWNHAIPKSLLEVAFTRNSMLLCLYTQNPSVVGAQEH